MNVQLSDIAKFAYGSGFKEGINGGRGFLAIDDYGQLTKVYTHRSDAKKIETLDAESFRKLRNGTDTLATRLYALAQGKGASRAVLGQVRTLLGLSDDGTTRVVDGQASHERQLLSRRVVASVISLIDRNVWTEGQGELSMANRAADVSSRGKVTNGQDVLREKAEIARLVGTVVMPETVSGLSERMVRDVTQLFGRELQKMTPDGSAAGEKGEKVTVYRQEAARVILPRVLTELKTLVREYPAFADCDLSGVNLKPVLRALPKSYGDVEKGTNNKVSYEIFPEKDKDGHPLCGKILDNDEVHEGAQENFRRLLPSTIRQALANGIVDPHAQVELRCHDGQFSVVESGERKAVANMIRGIALPILRRIRLPNNELKAFESYVNEFIKSYVGTFVSKKHPTGGLERKVIESSVMFLVRLARRGDPKQHDVSSLQSNFLARIAKGNRPLAARLLAFCPFEDCGTVIQILSNDAYVEELKDKPLTRARIYRMAVGSEPTVNLDKMSRKEFLTRIEDDRQSVFEAKVPDDPAAGTNAMGTVLGTGSMIFNTGVIDKVLNPPPEGVKVTRQDVKVMPIPYVLETAKAQGEANAENQIFVDARRDLPSFQVGSRVFAFFRKSENEAPYTMKDAKPLFAEIDKLCSTPEQRLVTKFLMTQAGLQPVTEFIGRVGEGRRMEYVIEKNDFGTVRVTARNVQPTHVKLSFTYEIKETGENEMIDFTFEEKKAKRV